MIKKILLLSFVFFQYISYAQTEHAWIYLADKENVDASIQNPITILTQKAIDRKSTHNVIIDERDVPVNENYILQLKQQVGIEVKAKSKWFNAVHVIGLEDDINALSSLSFVDHIDFADKSLNSESRMAAANNKFEVEETLVDFVYGDTQNQVEMINVDKLHLDDFTGEGITIAVLDAGFPNVNTMGAFQRLRDNDDLLGGYDFVDRVANPYAFTGNTHGTKVLSDMAGFIQDMFVGTAPDASYYVFRTEDAGSETPVEESYWVEAAERADSLGVDIINSSLGYRVYTNGNYTHLPEDLDGNTTFITKGANIANEKGILVVTSAGNSGISGVGAPADGTGVLSIGAVDFEGNYASFSSQGSVFQSTQKPDVAARGASTFVINENNAIVNNNGTSFSSPIMAGGIASLWQALPNATNEEIKQYVRMSASQYHTPDFFLGFGIPNLELAYNIGLSLQEDEFFEFNIFPNPVKDVLNIQIPSANEVTSLLIYDILGKAVFQKIMTTHSSTIDTSSMSSGVYIMSLESEKESKTFKFIKS
ncbi:S8 family serine peptidase [Ichthyenterobacterium magnum]|uniref:Putative secreted protein (Por secretion system target) n=1 Tax=Ichthyenterobacterium magnum TaxID=1230530 RepID=A0A420DUT8_9FLAO|nr:S8 family serine peptidase [Ichthyenterobacterium magnum]RKE98036.1 putative secreted protein (Por secretion system target) [Ichthyenterobacterium magnum]